MTTTRTEQKTTRRTGMIVAAVVAIICGAIALIVMAVGRPDTSFSDAGRYVVGEDIAAGVWAPAEYAPASVAYAITIERDGMILKPDTGVGIEGHKVSSSEFSLADSLFDVSVLLNNGDVVTVPYDMNPSWVLV